MEVCMECHLETTSFPLPNAIQRYERGPFSYRPGEPLGDFILNFDHAPGTGRDDKFEIVNAAYRLRRSACFLKSSGKMLCTTCHNPHDIPRGEDAARHYTAVCRQCHASLSTSRYRPENTRARRLASIATCPNGAPRTSYTWPRPIITSSGESPREICWRRWPERQETGANAYRGPVVLYYPETLPHTPENDLDLAVAQVKQSSNLTEGIAQLTAAIEKYSPAAAGVLSGTRRGAAKQRAVGKGPAGVSGGRPAQSEIRGWAAETRDGAATFRPVCRRRRKS